MTRHWKQLAAVVVLLAFARPALSQEARPKAPAQPALVQVKDTPGLPRVLLIGDSISMGYTLAVRKELAGKANVHRPATNCGPTTRGVAEIDKWLGDGKWDVIHFNFGLHDLKYVDADGKNVDPVKGRPQVSRDDYRKNLEALVAKMKKTGAKLIFCTTTPVPAGAAARLPGDELAYNKIAVEVMKNHGVAINDLYEFALPRLKEIQRPANVHFTPEGSEVLAKQVAASVVQALDKE